MILMIDNYDSFTYNLVQAMRSLGADVKVVRNDEIDVDGIAALNPSAIVLSPGPGNPDSAGVTLAAIKAFAGKVPMKDLAMFLYSERLKLEDRLGKKKFTEIDRYICRFIKKCA